MLQAATLQVERRRCRRWRGYSAAGADGAKGGTSGAAGESVIGTLKVARLQVEAEDLRWAQDLRWDQQQDQPRDQLRAEDWNSQLGIDTAGSTAGISY